MAYHAHPWIGEQLTGADNYSPVAEAEAILRDASLALA